MFPGSSIEIFLNFMETKIHRWVCRNNELERVLGWPVDEETIPPHMSLTFHGPFAYRYIPDNQPTDLKVIGHCLAEDYYGEIVLRKVVEEPMTIQIYEVVFLYLDGAECLRLAEAFDKLFPWWYQVAAIMAWRN